MVELRIHHRTAYRYRQPVSLGTHRLMLRPRESRDLHLLSNVVTVMPEGTVNWSTDVYGNAIATVTFGETSDTLVIDSLSHICLTAVPFPIFAIAASASSFPYRYSDDEWTDLGSLTVRQYAENDDLQAWAQRFVAGYPTDTLSLLRDINTGIGRGICYQARADEGTQSPGQTLSLGTGSCRDLTTLFVEAVRCLGFGARTVSGYLHDPMHTLLGSTDAGSTHAWAEVYLPGAGWIAFDPTNGRVGGASLIPVAVARDIRQAMPVRGTFVGPANAFHDMSVVVTVDA